MWKKAWDFVRVWVFGPFAVLAGVANIIKAPSNWGVVMDWIPPWITEDWVRLALGALALAYLVWLVRMIKQGFIKPLPFGHPAKSLSSFQPIDEILEHVATVVGDSDKHDGYPLARSILRQAASDGAISLRGKRWTGPNQHSPIAVNIPLGFWREHDIPIYAMHTASHHTELESSSQTRGPEHTYYDLEALWLDVLRLWPRRS